MILMDMQSASFYMVMALALLMLVGGFALFVAASRLKPKTREPRRRYMLIWMLLVVGSGVLTVGGILACNVAVTLFRIG